MSGSYKTDANWPSKPVQFTLGDAERIANVVKQFERGRRPRKPSFLPRAFFGGGASASIRLARFAGAWTNDPLMNANVKPVMLYRKVIPSDPLVPENPNAWEPDLDSEGFPIVVEAVNLLAWAGSTQQDVLKWCYVTKVSSASNFWIMIGAEC